MDADLKILKKAASFADMQPGEWFLDNALADAEGRQGANRVAVRCPVCRLRTWLNKAHRIDAQGHVRASCLCPRATAEFRRRLEGTGAQSCTWHEFITLDGWTPVEGI